MSRVWMLSCPAVSSSSARRAASGNWLGSATRFSVLVRDWVRDGVCVAVSLAPWMRVSRGVCVVGLTGFEPATP